MKLLEEGNHSQRSQSTVLLMESTSVLFDSAHYYMEKLCFDETLDQLEKCKGIKHGLSMGMLVSKITF